MRLFERILNLKLIGLVGLVRKKGASFSYELSFNEIEIKERKD